MFFAGFVSPFLPCGGVTLGSCPESSLFVEVPLKRLWMCFEGRLVAFSLKAGLSLANTQVGVRLECLCAFWRSFCGRFMS